jgi:hypothetical protein
MPIHNLRTFQILVPGEFGDFVNVLGDVPITVNEAVTFQPHLKEWIVTETKRQLDTLGTHYPAEIDRLRTELASIA